MQIVSALQAALLMLNRDALRHALKPTTPYRVEGRGKRKHKVYTVEATGEPLPPARLAIPGRGQGARLQGGLPPRVRDNNKLFNTHAQVFGAIPPLRSEHGPTKGFWTPADKRRK